MITNKIPDIIKTYKRYFKSGNFNSLKILNRNQLTIVPSFKESLMVTFDFLKYLIE